MLHHGSRLIGMKEENMHGSVFALGVDRDTGRVCRAGTLTTGATGFAFAADW
jgi:hypothetical protein